MTFEECVRRAKALGASDLHFETDTPVVVRVQGELSTITDDCGGKRVEEFAKSLSSADTWAQFIARGSADFSSDVSGTRCRINLFRTVRGTAIAVRLLSASVSSLRACNLHPDLRRFTDARAGLLVLSGPTGSGKSTTLAALIEEINLCHARNIITIESPLEYLFTNRRSFIRQREVPSHSPTYEQAIVDALRENPDVLVIGEMRTPEVMRLTLDAAETGHLVVATLHSATCAEALSRLCMSFPAEIQSSIRAQLADCLVGVVCQRLDFLKEHQLRAPRCEILTGNSAAKGTIRSGQFSQIATVIQAGGEDGMWSFDRYRRWMAQKTDWVLQTPAAPISADATQTSAARRANSAPTSAVDTHAIEISLDDDFDLAEIAKKIDEGGR